LRLEAQDSVVDTPVALRTDRDRRFAPRGDRAGSRGSGGRVDHGPAESSIGRLPKAFDDSAGRVEVGVERADPLGAPST